MTMNNQETRFQFSVWDIAVSGEKAISYFETEGEAWVEYQKRNNQGKISVSISKYNETDEKWEDL